MDRRDTPSPHKTTLGVRVVSEPTSNLEYHTDDTRAQPPSAHGVYMVVAHSPEVSPGPNSH